MPDDTITIHAARVDCEGDIWVQVQAGGWCAILNGKETDAYDTREELEEAWGPTRPVRIVTTDPGDDELRRLANARLGWPACSGCGTALTRDDTSAECNRCVTTDPDPERELLDEISGLTQALVDEKAAHAKTRQNFAEYVDDEAYELPEHREQRQRHVTTDPPGQFDPPLTDAEKAAFLAADRELNGPAGLSAEQEIRARAAQLAIAEYEAAGPFGWKLGDWCAWIRDGVTPDEVWIRDGKGVPDAAQIAQRNRDAELWAESEDDLEEHLGMPDVPTS